MARCVTTTPRRSRRDAGSRPSTSAPIVEEYDAADRPRGQGGDAAPGGPLLEPDRRVAPGPGGRRISPGSAPKHRKKRTDAERELERLRKRNARLEAQLAKHKQALEIQGKASELLARLLAESADTETEQQP